MKVIDVPPTIKVALARKFSGEVTETKDLPFREAAIFALDNYADSAERVTSAMYRQVAKIVETLELSDGHVRLEDADYDLLKAAMVDRPPWGAGLGRQVLPYIDAVEKAQDVTAPTEKK